MLVLAWIFLEAMCLTRRQLPFLTHYMLAWHRGTRVALLTSKVQDKSAPGGTQFCIHLQRQCHPQDLYHKRRISKRCPVYNFNLKPVGLMFSAIDIRYRDMRAKAVAPLFAPARLRSETNRVMAAAWPSLSTNCRHSRPPRSRYISWTCVLVYSSML